MLFDPRAALARIRAAGPVQKTQPDPPPRATRATYATQHPPAPAHVAQVARVARPQPSKLKIAAPVAGAVVLPLHGPDTPSAARSMMRLDWSGEWVSRDRWDSMSDLERHGPQGRLFCGKCWRYRERDTALACLNGEPCQ